MLRDVDGWDGEHFSFGAASAGADAAPAAGPTRVAIDNGAEGPSATIPDSHLLFTAQFSRAGTDLVLTGEDGKAFLVHDYFATDARARLLSTEGAALSPEVVGALAGPLAPGQYAQAGAAQPAVKAVGRVVQADGDATIVRNGVAMAAHAGDAILKGDVLQTVTGTFGVTFNDGSTLNLTANSRLVVNEFVYDPNGSANSQLLDLVQGSLTFISGEVAHNGDMKIGTPVATMAIRGTVGGVTTANDGTVHFYVSQSATGAVILDSRGTVIANVVQDGPLIVVRPVGPLQVLAEEVQKTPAQLATELAALQQIVGIQSVGQQIIQQFFQQDPNANPNPQSTDKPHTQFQIDLHTNDPNGQNGNGDPGDDNSPPTDATVFIPVTDPDTGVTTTHVEDVKLAANLAPLNFGPLLQAVNEDSALTFSSDGQNAISVFDADTASLTVTLTATHGVLTLRGVDGLAFTSGDGGGDATMTFSGTQAAINDALEGMSFTPDADYNGQASVTIVTGDGTAANVTQTVAITVNAVNDAPVIGQPCSSALAYTENQEAAAIDPALVLSDVDSATLSGATVTISGNFHSDQDVLSFIDQNGISGSYDSETGVLTLSGAASVADYQAALQSVAYANTSEAPSAGTRTISFQVDDGEGANHASNVAAVDVTVTPVNDAPVIAQPDSVALDYTENQEAAAIDPALTISDVDSATLSGATVTISGNFHSDQDVLSFIDQNGISGSYDSETGVLTLSGAASVADYQAALQSVAYANSSEAPSADTRTISFQVDDGEGANHASNVATVDVTVTPVNDAPVIAQPDSAALAYTENQEAAAIDPALTISDVDSATLSGATVTISGNFHSDQDVLSFVDQNGISGSYDSETGVLTLNGAASVADYQAALQSVAYANSSEAPSADTRTISFQVDDGEGANHASNVATADVTVTPVNDVPVLAQPDSAALDYTENQEAAAIDPALTISDVDSATLSGATVTISGNFHSDQDVLSFVDQNGISGSYDSETGVLTLSGAASVADYQAALQSVVYGNVSEAPSADTRTISFQVDDGEGANHASNVATADVTVTPVNDVPVLDYFNLTVDEGGTTVLQSDDFLINDLDSSGFFFSVANVTGGQFEVLTEGNWVSAPTGGFTADDIAAGNVRFVHDGGEAAPAFKIWVSDGIDAGQAIDPTVDFSVVNHAPTITWGGSGSTPDQIQHETSTGLSLDFTDGVRGLATDGTLLYVDDNGGEIDVYTRAGAYVDSHAVDNLSGGTGQMTFVDGHLYARNGGTIYLISTEDWSSTAVSAPEDHGLLTAKSWVMDDLLSLPDGRIGVLGANEDYTTTLRLYTIGEDGLSLTWSEDIILETDGLPGDNHGSASDGTYIYIADYGLNGYRSYSLATGELVYTSGDITDSGTGANVRNPTFLTHDHVNGEYILGDYDIPVAQLSGGSSNGILVAENTTAVTTITATDLDAGTTLTYSIAGGADADLFDIDPLTGALSFRDAPDYEAPADQGSDNSYNVTVQVSDGALTDSRGLVVTVANVEDGPPEAQSAYASVSEEGLLIGLTDETGNPDTTDSASSSGTIVVSGVGAEILTFSLGLPETELSSGGQPIVWTIDEDGVLTGKAGTQPIITVSINSAGAYTVTLLGPVDHADADVEDVKELSIPVNVSDGQQTVSTTLTVAIEDDSPKAPNYQVVSNAAVTQDFNVAFVLDYSGSISSTQLDTMLEAVKTAAQSIFAGTTGEVKITVVGFGSNAATIGTYTTYADFAAAIDHTNSHTGGTRPVNSNGTNFDRAVQQVIADFSPVQGAKNDVFFLSDGQSSVSSQAEAWGDFVTGHNISVTAIGIGSGISVPGLQTVDVDGGVPIEVAQFSGLVDSLLELVRPELTGNVVTGGGFGADGGHIATLTVDGTVYYFDGTTVTYDSDGEMVPLAGTTLDRDTDFGGHITFYFKADGGHAAGEWVYVPPGDASVSGAETFHYQLTDNDGDASGGNLTLVVEAGDPITWTNAVNGDWFADANWSTGARPTGDDNAAITVPGSYTVTEHGSVAVSSLVIGSGVTLSVSTQPDSPTAQLDVINLTFNDGTMVADAGAIAFYGDVVSNGALISRNNSMLYFTGTLAGALTLDGGNAIFTNAVGAEATVDFAAPSSALLLLDAADFNGHITSFQPGDEIDLYFGQSGISQVSYEIGNHSVDFTYTLNDGAPTTIVVGTDASYEPENYAVLSDSFGSYALVFNETWIGGEGNVDLNDASNWNLGITPNDYIAVTVDDGSTHNVDLGGGDYALAALFVGAETQLDITNGTLGMRCLQNAGSLSIANGEIDFWTSTINLAGASIEARAGGSIYFGGAVEGSGLFQISGGTMEFGDSTGQHITITMNADTGDTLQLDALPVFASDFKLSGFGNGDTIAVRGGISGFYFQDYGSQDLLHYAQNGTDAWIWLTDGDYSRDNFSVSSQDGDTLITYVPTISWAAPGEDNSVAFGFRHVAGASLSVDWGDGSQAESGATEFEHAYAVTAYPQAPPYAMTVQVGADQTFSYSVQVASDAAFTYLSGTAGNDILVGPHVSGDVGHSVTVAFDGGAGDDLLFAGSGGADFFMFKQGGGHDIVVGFNTAEDYIDASDFGVGLADVISPQQFIASAQDTAQGLVFTIGNDSILLQDVHQISGVNVWTIAT